MNCDKARWKGKKSCIIIGDENNSNKKNYIERKMKGHAIVFPSLLRDGRHKRICSVIVAYNRFE